MDEKQDEKGGGKQLDRQQNLGDRWRRHAVRAGGAASDGARAGYARFRAHLLRYPPGQRAVLMVLWACAALLGLLLLYVLLLIPVTPGIRDLKQALSLIHI